MSFATSTFRRAGDFGRQPNSIKKKILVVDDDAVVLRSLSIKLKANGFDVLIAKEGGEAIRTVRTERPDLILLDISFPVNVNTVSWDGFLIMEWLKRLEEADQVPHHRHLLREQRKKQAPGKRGWRCRLFPQTHLSR